MIIFDRWGNLIFESSDLYQGWNGHANEGKILRKWTPIFGKLHLVIG